MGKVTTHEGTVMLRDGRTAEDWGPVGGRVRRVLSDLTEFDAKEMRRKSSLTADLGTDSLMLVEMIIALEEFDLDVVDDEWDGARVATVGDVVAFVEARVPAKERRQREGGRLMYHPLLSEGGTL